MVKSELAQMSDGTIDANAAVKRQVTLYWLVWVK